MSDGSLAAAGCAVAARPHERDRAAAVVGDLDQTEPARRTGQPGQDERAVGFGPDALIELLGVQARIAVVPVPADRVGGPEEQIAAEMVDQVKQARDAEPNVFPERVDQPQEPVAQNLDLRVKLLAPHPIHPLPEGVLGLRSQDDVQLIPGEQRLDGRWYLHLPTVHPPVSGC